MGEAAPLNHSFPRNEPRPPYKPAYSAPLVYTRDFAYEDNGPVVIIPKRMAGRDITSASAKTFAELLSGDTVDIYVGPEKRHWSIHQNLLCHHSSYFELEFSQHEVPKKNGRQHLELLEDDPLGFELLVKWLYQGILSPASDFPTDEAKYDYAVACHKLWLLCDKFDMVRLKNLAMDTYRRCLNESQLVPDADEINDIYRRSPMGSSFRALMVNIAARQIMDPDVERDAEAYRQCFESNSDFAIEMVTAIRHMSGGILFNDPTHGDPCAYHDHNDTSGCPMQGKGKTRAKKMEGEDPVIDIAGKSEPATSQQHAEKRTPRKLRTPSKSVGNTTGQPPTPKSLPSRLNGPGSRITNSTLPLRSMSEDSEYSYDRARSATNLKLQTPQNHSHSLSPDVSPLHRKSAERQLRIASITANLQSTDEGSAAVRSKVLELLQELDSQSAASTNDQDVDATSPSRKRKRTPRKLREKQPVTVSTSGASSRADSVISGPRKLRVNSIVRRLESNARA